MYRDDLLLHVLCMMFLLVLLSIMFNFLSSKSAKHLLSQNIPIERSDLFFLSGKFCACRASMGRVSWGSKAVWDENMMCPYGMRMPSGLITVILFTHGLFYFKKCPDVPESAAARLSTYLCVIVFVVAMTLILLSTNLSHTFRHFYQTLFRILLPIVLFLVAAVMCPCFWYSQVLLLCHFLHLKPWLQQ